MSRFTRTIASGSGVSIDVSGTAVKVREASGLLSILPDNRNAARIMQSGDKWKLKSKKEDPTFKNLHIKNKTASAITFVIEVHEISEDEFESDGANVTVNTHDVTQGAASDPWSVSNKVSTSSVDDSVPVLVATTALVAASALNKKISIQPQGGDIWIAKGAAATADSNSMKIADGQLYECETTEVINAIALGATVNTWWEAQRA